MQGWSYYGGWYGMPYEEWCAMFVSYCLEKAGIGEGIMPHSANCNRWKGYLGARYIDDEDNYYPEAGDLIFFHHDRVSKDPNFPNHIGIVTGYDAGKNLVYTVEGNSGKSVRTHEYDHESSVIVGYASMRYCMLRWDDEYKSRIQQNLTNALLAAYEEYNRNKAEEEAAEIAGTEAVDETEAFDEISLSVQTNAMEEVDEVGEIVIEEFDEEDEIGQDDEEDEVAEVAGTLAQLEM